MRFQVTIAVVALVLSLGSQAPNQVSEGIAQQQRVLQALNRLTWGPEPGQVAEVEKIGLKQWIDDQLHPDRIAENPVLTAALAPLVSLTMTPGQVIAAYPPPEVIRQMAMGHRPFPIDPTLRGIVESEIEAQRQRQNAKAADVRSGVASAGLDEPVVMAAPALASVLPADHVTAITSGPVRDRVATIESLSEAMREQVLRSLPRRDAIALLTSLPAGQARQLAYYLRPQQVVTDDLEDAKIFRAVYSNRQLEDVLTDFWFNHFNVYIRKGPERDYLAAYLRTAIRPHVLGKFHDLLLATATSPAMMFYLDNWQSVDPKVNKRGINENYGRELMELHTLGVDTGYTQQDVIEVARCFTGWTIRQPQRDAEFFYNDKLHDHGAKVVLGVAIPAGGGMSDGLRVLDILSRSPATAHHISYELAQRFIADTPPPALVNRMAARYLSTDGDLRQVMQTMINSPEFWQPQYFRDKVKSPFEMVISSVRAIGADVSNPRALSNQIAAMGEPLYAKEPPTGYLNSGDAWIASSGLVARMNFALRLARNQIPGVQVDPDAGVLASAELAPAVAELPNNAPTALNARLGLLLGSPAFQHH